MTRLKWDQIGDRRFETGVDRGVLFPTKNDGTYDAGVAWSGLTTVTESPSGAESNKQYADNGVYVDIRSIEEFGFTIEAFAYPEEFEACDGTAVVNGVAIGQQGRRPFAFAYRSLVGNDVEGTDYGTKINLVWGAMANPSEKTRGTVNDSPEASAFSWECSTTPVEVEGTNPLTGKPFKPTAFISVDSTRVPADAFADLEDLVWGAATGSTSAKMPTPAEVLALFPTVVTP